MPRISSHPARRATAGLVAVAAVLAVGCDGGDRAADAAPSAIVRGALGERASSHDVAWMRYEVVPFEGTCADPPLVTLLVSLAEEPQAFWREPGDVNGTLHPFADAPFTLPPGHYRICAEPLRADLTASELCLPVEVTTKVEPQQTQDVVVLAPCAAAADATVDPGFQVVVVLNDPPRIDDLTPEPSKFITTCEEALLEVFASDPNGDALTFLWAIVSGPPGGDGALTVDGPTASFRAGVEGDYEVQVTVSDGHGGLARLSFPIHVTADPECPPICEPSDLLASFSVFKAVSDPFCTDAVESRAIWMAGFYDGDLSHIVELDLLPGATFDWFLDGKATLTGVAEVTDLDGGAGVLGDLFLVDVYLTWRGTGPANAGFLGPIKTLFPWCQPDDIVTSWEFFDIDYDASTFVRVGDPGDVTTISDVFPAGGHVFQLGLGASNKDASLGAAGWFDYEHTPGEGAVTVGAGDFNLTLVEKEIPTCP